jgi:hypothetical protein
LIRKIVLSFLMTVSILLASQVLISADPDPCECLEPWCVSSQVLLTGGCYACLVVDITNPGGCYYYIYEFYGVVLHLTPYYLDTSRYEHRDLISKVCYHYLGYCFAPECPETITEYYTVYFNPCTIPCP